MSIDSTPSITVPLRLYFIRHGKTEWSLSGQYTGRADIQVNNPEETKRVIDTLLAN